MGFNVDQLPVVLHANVALRLNNPHFCILPSNYFAETSEENKFRVTKVYKPHTDFNKIFDRSCLLSNHFLPWRNHRAYIQCKLDVSSMGVTNLWWGSVKSFVSPSYTVALIICLKKRKNLQASSQKRQCRGP